jgi:hypothetical protein
MYVLKQNNEDWWIADWEGDPPRTLKKENAKVYQTKQGAKCAITYFTKRYSHIRKIDLVVESASYQPMPYE